MVSRRVLPRAGVAAGLLFLAAGLAPQVSTLMSAEPARQQPKVEKASPAAIQTRSAFAPTSPAELKIIEALAEPTTLDFVEEPLQGVMDFFSEQHGVPIVFNRRGLEDLNLGTDESITCTVSEVSFRSALELILRDLDLTWMIDSQVLLITSLDAAAARMPVKVYDVSDLVLCRDEDGRPWDDYDSLIDTITGSVAADTWEETVGGPGTIDGRTFASAKVLVVGQTWQVHLEIAQLLGTIRTIAKTHGTDAEPPMRKQPPPKIASAVCGFHGGKAACMSGKGCGKSAGAGMFSLYPSSSGAPTKPDSATGKPSE